jgi:Cof subfamily protein (haloacid dehalogenase superfamily)
MKPYKLVVFDLDGTLLTPSFELLPGTLAAVNDLRNSGYRITVATGRSYKSAKPFLDRLEITEPMVFSNGAVFDNPETGERELISGIPLESALIVLMLLPEFDISCKLHLAGGELYKTNDTPWPDEGIHFETGIIRPNLKAELTEDPLKIVFHAQKEQIDAFSERLDSVLGAKSQVRLFKSHEHYVEMTNKNVSKASAAKMLFNILGINPAEVIAVGDQDNDYEMIRDFGLGVVAGPGTENLMKVKDFQVPSPENGGIEVLRDWIRDGFAGHEGE